MTSRRSILLALPASLLSVGAWTKTVCPIGGTTGSLTSQVRREYQDSTVVALAKVGEIHIESKLIDEFQMDYWNAQLEVLEAWKGPYEVGDRIETRTSQLGCAADSLICLHERQSYLFYLHGQAPFAAAGCSRTRLSDLAADDLKILRRLYGGRALRRAK